MRKEHLIQQARVIMHQLKHEEKKNIKPYASFAEQLIALINDGRISTKADVKRFTGMRYPRPRMNKQWKTFGRVLEKNLRQLNKDSLLYLLGCLKQVITIEGNKESRDKKQSNQGRSDRSRN